MDIKVGDTVERVKGSHMGMGVGDTATVCKVVGIISSLTLKEFKGTHNLDSFKVVASQGETTRPTEQERWEDDQGVHFRGTRKTVADAWEEFGGEWEEPKDFVCIWNTKTNNFEFWLGGYNPVSHYYVVCDYQQFEAYGREQEAKQEGEKWTHTYNELKCRALITEPDREGYIVIVNELNEYYCVDDEELKPIKPTITKGEQEAIAKFIVRIWKKDNPDLRAEFEAFCKEHDIT